MADSVSDNSTTGISLDSRIFCGIVAFALTWAWYLSCFFSGIVVIPLDPGLKLEPLFRAVGWLGICFGLILLFATQHRIGKRVNLPANILAVIFSFPTIVITLITTTYEQMNISLELICWFVLGLSTSYYLVSQVVFLAAMAKKTRYFVICVSLISGGLFFLALNVIVVPVGLLVVAVLPIFMSSLFYYADKISDIGNKNTPALENRETLLTSLYRVHKQSTFSVFYGIVFGFAVFIAASTSRAVTGEYPIITIIALVLCGFVLAADYVRTKGVVNYDMTQWVLTVIATITFIVMPYLPPLPSVYLVSIVCLCFAIYQNVHFLILAEMVDEHREAGLGPLMVSLATFFFGVTIGWAVGTVSHQFFDNSGSFYSTVFLALSIVLVAKIAYDAMPKKKTENALLIGKHDDAQLGRWRESCKAICIENNLSKRQEEVFSYLAKGRNATFIANDLVISEHTAKAHIYRIYQKIGVHTQQELIDAVEGRIKK